MPELAIGRHQPFDTHIHILPLLAHARSAPLPHLILLRLLLRNALMHDLGVLVLYSSLVHVTDRGHLSYGQTYSSILTRLRTTTLKRNPVTLMLETLRRDQALDTRGLGVGRGAFLLGLDFAANDELADLYHRHRIVSMSSGVLDSAIINK